MSEEDSLVMRYKYLSGGYGYGHAKMDLLATLLEKYAAERTEFARLMSDRNALDVELERGAAKARLVGSETLGRVRKALGYS